MKNVRENWELGAFHFPFDNMMELKTSTFSNVAGV
jgi:hypothetical protein